MLYAKYFDAVKYKSQDGCKHFLDRVILVLFNSKTEEKIMRGIQHHASMRSPKNHNSRCNRLDKARMIKISAADYLQTHSPAAFVDIANRPHNIDAIKITMLAVTGLIE